MSYYSLLVTDNKGTYQLDTNDGRLILYITRTNAEGEACRISKDYYLVQVVPYDVEPHEAYIVMDK